MKLAALVWLALAARSSQQPQSQVPLPPQSRAAVGPLEDCFEVPRSICLQGIGGSFVVGPPRVPVDLVIWYRFDKSLPVDDSGNWHHLLGPDQALSPVAVGPGVLGRGGSAAFDGRSYRRARSSPALETQAFSIALWLYLLEDSVGSWRTVFKKGKSAEELMPALLLWPDERRLQVRVSLRADVGDGVLDSKGLLPLRRWTHVAVSCAVGGVLRLYVNGGKEGEVVLDTPPALGDGDLYLGRDPVRAGIRAYLDDFRWYNRAVPVEEIRALLYPSLTGIAVDFVRLGCSACQFTEAVRSCSSKTHLCSLQELFSGGFHVARAMGWLTASPEVWYHDDEGGDRFSGVRKLGLCCTD